jgi:WhiB family transcriptional regulator, redox-sensing transcriptional regulator
MTVRVNWREIAACRDTDPDLFFPIGTAGPALRQIEAAKRICRACPVQAPCLAWALDHGVDSGVWGGCTEAERRFLRRSAERNRRSARMTAVPVNDQPGRTSPLRAGCSGKASLGSRRRWSRP